MSKVNLLLVGATGETGNDILNGLVEDGTFNISLLIRQSSLNKPVALKLKEKGFKILAADTSGSVDELVPILNGIDVIVSTVGPLVQLDQLNLVDAAAKAGIKRFIPCGFITVCPPGGIMRMRDQKEVVYNRILVQRVPYTIIDVGYWHQLSHLPLPSGRTDYASLFPVLEIYAGGNTPTLLTDKRDIGRFVARIVKDERTLNQKVFTYSDEISQNQILDLIEKVTGEKIAVKHVSEEEMWKRLEEAKELAEGTDDLMKIRPLLGNQYNISKFLRGDNTLKNAKYLGYLDATKLYPDFKPIKFAEFYDEVLSGSYAGSLYAGRFK